MARCGILLITWSYDIEKVARYGILLITWSYDIGKVARYGILLITWSYNIEKVARCGIYWLQRWLPALGCYTTFTRSPCLLRPLGQWPVYDHREHWCYQATKSTFNLRDATTDQRKNNSSNQSISVGWMLGQHLMHWASAVPAFVIVFFWGHSPLCADNRTNRNQQTLTQCWFNAGPPSATLAQH